MGALVGRAPVRVLVVSSDGALTADVSTTLFAAGTRVRTSHSVADARRFFESTPTWPNVIAVSARLRDGTASELARTAHDHQVDALVLSEQDDDVEAWLDSLAEVGVPILAAPPDPASTIAKLATALRTRQRETCRTVLPDEVSLFVRRLVPTSEGDSQTRAVARGRVVVGDALFTLAKDASRVAIVTSSRGTSLACAFADRRAIVRVVAAHPHLTLELSWHAR